MQKIKEIKSLLFEKINKNKKNPSQINQQKCREDSIKIRVEKEDIKTENK